jgi:hypothetical protein
MSFVKLLEHDGDLTVVYELKDKPLVDKFVSKYNWPRPIPVSERLPEVGVEVFGWAEEPTSTDFAWLKVWRSKPAKGGVIYWWTSEQAGEDSSIDIKPPTHWLELPPSPE